MYSQISCSVQVRSGLILVSVGETVSVSVAVSRVCPSVLRRPLNQAARFMSLMA